jgi:hypothetical protein
MLKSTKLLESIAKVDGSDSKYNKSYKTSNSVLKSPRSSKCLKINDTWMKPLEVP